jgi:hypothetical protein
MQNTEGVQKAQTLDYQTDSLKKGKNTEGPLCTSF